MKKSFLSLFLVLVMLLTALPVTAGAAGIGADGTLPEITVTLSYYPETNTAGLIWNPIQNAELYYIWVKNNMTNREDQFAQVGSVLSHSAANGCGMTIDSSYFTDYGWGGSDYQVRIEAVDKYGKTIATGESNIISTNIEILDTPVAKFANNGVVSWDPVPNATAYTVLIYRSDAQFHVRADTTYQTKVDFTEHLTVGDQYLAIVSARNGKDYRESKSCQTDLITYQGRTVVSNFAISGITEPVDGEAPDTECLIPANCGYRPTIPNYGYVNWYTEDGDLMNPDTDTFTAGERYSAQVTLIPTEGYEFAASGLTGTMNGKDATASIFIASPKKKIYMSRWFTCSAASVGNTVSGTIKSYLDNAGAVKVTLANRSNSAIGFTKTVYGNSASFSFSDVPSGLYLLTLSKANHVSKSVTVAVTAGTPELKCQINPIGDVDNNGRVNSADAKAVSRHANEQELITDSYKLKCADVTAPKNKVNAADAKAIFQHANGQKSLWQ
ncbi:dockerin type I domain-containing protein [Ruminococcus sp.]|uniref:dockerin type I domain-containing protein n=1 Tax=Ruminococcus sp. TaxID=41978 RepID=UPI003869B7D2